MKKFELDLPGELTEKQIVTRLREIVQQFDLFISSEGTLKTIPGSIHWHINKPDHKGTLEATFYVNQKSFLLSYHENRYAEWIDKAVEKIKRELEQS